MISVPNVRIWLKSAFRLTCVWKIFCIESKIDAKKRRAIQRIKRPAIISKLLTVLIDCTDLITKSEFKYFSRAGRAEIIDEIVFGEACKNLTRTIITIIKRGITENKKLKAQDPAKDNNLFCKKYFVVRKILCEKVMNVNLRGVFAILSINCHTDFGFLRNPILLM